MTDNQYRDRRQCHPRRRRIVGPAMAVSLRILTWLLILVGLAPRLGGSAPAAAPRRSSVTGQRRDDWTSDQEERERGEGGVFPVLRASGQKSQQAAGHGRYRVSPSYRRLVADLCRPAASAEATDMLRRRMPPEALPWLDDILARQDWSALAWCVGPGRTEANSEMAMLRAAVDWTEARRPSAAPEQLESEAAPVQP